ncbi:MAG: nucleoid-associated protein [Bacteroidales bacterium]|nr:nucleoid-associated protein [Bacteroidales bacterium]
MISLDQAIIDSIVIHKIGMKAAQETDPCKNNFYSKHEIQFVDEETQYFLKNYFSLAMKSPDTYRFKENSASIAPLVTDLFEQRVNFLDSSIKLAETLYNTLEENDETRSEFYVVHFSNCIVDDLTVDAVGIFKSEHKEVFLKIMQNENEVNFQPENGISLKKLDKGCIIFNLEKEYGYIIKAQDNQKSGNLYWIDTFIDAKVIENEYFNTESFLKICKEFNEEVLAQNETVRNEDRVKFLQNSLNYFQRNQTFDESQFKEETIGNPEVIEAFDNFKQRYKNQFEIEAPTSFDIDEIAVKKSKKYLKSVIKLDKNFHIYVHSRPEFLERGYDENRGKSFYKVFFEVES